MESIGTSDGNPIADASMAAAGADSEDSDVDPTIHDFNAEGVLPEAITSVHSVKTVAQKHALLAKDCCEVDSIIGMADIETRYPKKLLWLHVNDGSGEKSSTAGFVLLPLDDPSVRMNSLQESNMMKSGTYLDVPCGVEYVAVSKKLAVQARRALQDHWKFEGNMERATRFSYCKTSRAQFGIDLHKIWLEDIVKTCGVPVVVVCDYAHGCAEIQRAILEVKTGVVAVSANVRLCSWAHDPRKVFSDIGSAVCKTALAKLYLARKLTIPGHFPIEEPGERPNKTRRLITALLPVPLKTSSIDTEGQLIIPSDTVIQTVIPFALDSKSKGCLDELRIQFPQTTTAPQPAPGGPTPADPEQAPAAGNVYPPSAGGVCRPGAVASDLVNLRDNFKHTKITEAPLPPGNHTVCTNVVLMLTKTESEGQRGLWLHNKSAKDVALPPGTYLGKAGSGQLVSLVNTTVEAGMKPYMWLWTRISNYKGENKLDEYNNGLVIFATDESAASDRKPKTHTLADVEK